jgi:uncharacterized protein (TIGR02270 family)
MPRATYIPDILEEHLDEVAFLWGQRQVALYGPDYTVFQFFRLEWRIAAHGSGLLAVGDSALPLLEDRLTHDDPLTAFAAAYALLQFGTPSATGRVVEAFGAAEGAKLAGLEAALSHVPLDAAAAKVEVLRRTASAPVALAAATALTFSAIPVAADEVVPFLRHDEADVRRRAWRLIGYLGASVGPKAYAAAMRDPDATVRRAALWAGAWCGEQGVLTVCRGLAAEPKPDTLEDLELLAILAGPEDLQLLKGLVAHESLGPGRYRLAGAYGHPELMDLVLTGIANEDLPVALAAGAAFTKVTGLPIESGTRVTLPPEDGGKPDEFEAEFLDEVQLPDADLARRHWARVGTWLQRATRMQRGFDVGRPLSEDEFAALDMRSRWEMWLRARFHGAWRGSPLRLERFPQQG